MSEQITGVIQQYRDGKITRDDMIHSLGTRIYPRSQRARRLDGVDAATAYQITEEHQHEWPEDGTGQELTQAVVNGLLSHEDYAEIVKLLNETHGPNP